MRLNILGTACLNADLKQKHPDSLLMISVKSRWLPIPRVRFLDFINVSPCCLLFLNLYLKKPKDDFFLLINPIFYCNPISYWHYHKCLAPSLHLCWGRRPRTMIQSSNGGQSQPTLQHPSYFSDLIF